MAEFARPTTDWVPEQQQLREIPNSQPAPTDVSRAAFRADMRGDTHDQFKCRLRSEHLTSGWLQQNGLQSGEIAQGVSPHM